MTEKKTTTRIAALILALAFAAVTVFSAASVPAFAAAKPARVTGIAASAKSSFTIKIKWKKAADAKKYQIYRATSKNGKYKKIKTTTGLSYINRNLKSNKTYFYKVRALNGSAKGAFSAVKSARTRKLTAVSVDKAAKTVTINAKVNGKYFKTSTRHFMVDKKGFNAGTAMLTSYCSPKSLYNGLVKAGGVSWSKSADITLENGEKNSAGNAENKNYSKLDVTVSWGNETHKLKECVTTKKGGKTAPKINMIFSGNPKAAAKTPSGCMVCLDSCYIGIAANSAYGLCVIDDNNPSVYARADVLPKGGTIVEVTFRIK